MSSAIAKVPTAHGSKYLQQLCKHWQHNLAVEFTPEHGTVAFPKDARGATWTDDALVTFDADRSEEHTSELQSLMRISYAVFCLKKKSTHTNKTKLHINQCRLST